MGDIDGLSLAGDCVETLLGFVDGESDGDEVGMFVGSGDGAIVGPCVQYE